MGYFTQQLYNAPMSTYVDPRLDILQNSMNMVQQRHDKGVADMNAYEILAANMQVAEGDMDYKNQKIAELQKASQEIASRGDYAMATPRINMAARGFLADENLIAMQENYKAIQDYQKRMQELGANALDFNPATGWKTIGEDGKARRFAADVQAKLDWDSRAQEVSKLIADERPIGLSDAAVAGYLQNGSISGISDTKLRNYLHKAVDRFNKSSEGSQMKRKLMEIDGLSAEQADAQIARFVYNVGSAQVHEKRNIDYQYDQYAAQQRSFKHSDDNREDQQAHDKEMMSLRQAKEEQEKKTKSSGSGKGQLPVLSPAANLINSITRTNPDGSTGTTIAPAQAGRLGLIQTTIKEKSDNGNEISYPGFVVQNGVLAFGKTFNPATGNYSVNEQKRATDYWTALNTKREVKKEYENYLTEYMRNPEANKGTIYERKYKEYMQKVAPYDDVLKGFSAKEKKAVQQYENALKGDKVALAESIGTKLQNTRLDAVLAQDGDTNAFTVDGKIYLNMEAKIPGSELSKLLSPEEIRYLYDIGQLKGNDPSRLWLGTNLTDGVWGGDTYTLKMATQVNPDATILEQYDLETVGTENAFERSLELGTERTDVLSRSAAVQSFAQQLASSDVTGRKEFATNILNNYEANLTAYKQSFEEAKAKYKAGELEEEPVDIYTSEQEKADRKDLEKYRKYIENYDKISDIQKQELYDYLTSMQ